MLQQQLVNIHKVRSQLPRHPSRHQARQILGTLAREQGPGIFPAAVGDAITLNAAAINQPGNAIDVVVETGTNPLEIYRGQLRGNPPEERIGTFNYLVERNVGAQTEWHIWFREIVWFGNKKGAYIHPIQPR